MAFEAMLDFLEELQEKNQKEWMDLNRKRYRAIRTDFVSWLDKMNKRLAELDPLYFDTPGKKAINKINNNLLYHPNRPVYKDHFGAGLDQLSKQGDYYIQIGVNRSMLAGGYWRPDNKILKSIRDAIDYNGEELLRIMQEPKFKLMYGGLVDSESRLTQSPQAYDSDHRFIELLMNKTFAVEQLLSRKQIVDKNFDDLVVESYLVLLPFRRYLNQAITV